MLTVERQERIISLFSEKTFCHLKELAAQFNVSISTVRRDLDCLEERGIVKRTHGGAMFLGDRGALPRFGDRQTRMAKEKAAIGACAAERVEDGETIIIAGGTTPYQVAVHLRDSGKTIQVVTVSLHVANLFADANNVQLIGTGGLFFPASGIYLGTYAENLLKSIRVQKAFVGVAGITAEGFYNSNPLVVETERCMLKAAAEVYVVADHTKFGRNALAYLCDFSMVTAVITDSAKAIDSKVQTSVAEKNLNVISSMN